MRVGKPDSYMSLLFAAGGETDELPPEEIRLSLYHAFDAVGERLKAFCA